MTRKFQKTEVYEFTCPRCKTEITSVNGEGKCPKCGILYAVGAKIDFSGQVDNSDKGTRKS